MLITIGCRNSMHNTVTSRLLRIFTQHETFSYRVEVTLQWLQQEATHSTQITQFEYLKPGALQRS